MKKYFIVAGMFLIYNFLFSGLNDNLLSETHNGDLKKVKFLIKKGAEVNCFDGFGNSPLYIASGTDNVKIVEALLAAGADPNIINVDKETPLHKAAIKGNKEIVKLLLDNKADQFLKNKFGDTPLMLAVSKNFYDVLNFMIESDKKIIYVKNDKGSEAIHFAAENGNLKIFSLLVENGADIEAQDASGNTPLILAAKNGCIEIAEYILNKNK